MNEVQQKFLAGFDLGGWVRHNMVHLDGHEEVVLGMWPDSIEAFGRTYELENVVDGATDPDKGQWQNAQYV